MRSLATGSIDNSPGGIFNDDSHRGARPIGDITAFGTHRSMDARCEVAANACVGNSSR